MPNRVSPGVYVNVFDFSDYAPQLGSAALCVLGGASKGPLNTPTLVTSEAELVRQFGKPLLTDYGLQAAVQFLKKGRRLIYCRVANSAATASVPVPGLAAGTDAVAATGTIGFTASTNPSDGEYVSIRDTVPTAELNNDAVGAIGNTAITLGGAGVTARISDTNMTGGTASVRATGQIRFIGGALPVDADTITISDGATSKVFEFDDDVSVGGGNISVTIVAGDPYATMANLITAINAAVFNVSAVAGHTTVLFEFDDNGSVTGGSTGVLIGTTAAATLLNLITAINSHATVGVDATNSTVTIPQLTLTNQTAGIDGNAPIEEAAGAITIAGMTGGVDAIAGGSLTVMSIEAKNEGTWGNSIQVTVQATTTIGADAGNFDLLVRAPVDNSGTLGLVERFNNLSADSDDTRFAETVISDGILGEQNPSQYLVLDVLSDGGTVSAADYTLGTGGGTVGTDGVSGLVSTDYIGSVSGQSATGLKAVRNPERVEFNLLAIPGVSHKDVIDEMFEVAEFRNDCQVIVDPPFGATIAQIIDWHNGLSSVFANSPTQPLDNRFGMMAWSWVKQDDKYNSRSLFLPPSGFVAAACAYNDLVAGPQFVPAGHNRGRVDGTEVEYSPDQEERDLLVGDQNRINPIVDFAQGGLTLFGNRTLQRRRTALDNIHTQRMLLYAQKLVSTAVKFLVFEPNDSVTWLKFTAMVNPILENLKAGRGIEQFFVLCDETTNPPAQRSNKMMKGIIKIKPVESAEMIEVDFALYATGAEFTEV